MARSKKDAESLEKNLTPETVETAASDVGAEAIETVSEPEAIRVESETRPVDVEPQPALGAASRSASRAPRMSREEREQLGRMRQEEMMVVGKYVSAQKRGSILQGVVGGVEIRGNHAFWVIYDDPMIVYIPFRDALTPEDGDDNFPFNDADRQRQLLSRSFDANIPFTVEQVIPDDGAFLVYGSRLKALENIRNQHFGEKANAPVRVGDDIVATVFGPSAHAVWVTANGVDVRLTAGQLSHRFIENAIRNYRPGEKIKVRVQGIRVGEDGKVNLRLSALPCELEECKSRHRRIRKGNRFPAVITRHRLMESTDAHTNMKTSNYSVSMWLESVNVPGFASVTPDFAKDDAHAGERVTVEVIDIGRNGYVRCRIVAFLPD